MKMKKMLAIIMSVCILFSLASLSASAAGTATRTQTLNLNDAEFAQDQANEAEGWSWDADTLTLTLDGANFDTGTADCIVIVADKTITVNMQGESTLSSEGNGKAFSRGYKSGKVVFEGEGTLNVNYSGVYASMDIGSFEMKSGTVNINGGAVYLLNALTISGGNLNLDTVGSMASTGQGQDGFYILGAGCDITGGNVDIRAERIGIFVQGDHDYDSVRSDRGLVITGGDVTLYGGMCATWIGYMYARETVIDTTGTVTIEGSESGLGLYTAKGSIEVKKGTINNPDNLEVDKLFRIPDSKVRLHAADYSAVDAALATVPADLSVYTEESAAAVQAAVDAVEKELTVLDQAKVDEYAKAIEDAVAALEENTPDSKIKEFFENLFNSDCAVLNWLKRVVEIIVAFFTGLFNGLLN